MGLFTKKWESGDYKKRLKGIEKLKDQQILIKLASQDPILEVRVAAIGKIDDDLFLAQLCNALDEGQIWRAAVPRIHDNQILVSLAIATKNNGLVFYVMDALKSLNDEAAFQAILGMAETPSAALSALERVNSEQALCQAALSNKHERVRRKAVSRIKPGPVLNRVALEDKEARVRAEAAELVEDQPTLAKLALRDPDANVRSNAVGRVSDKAVLYQVLADDSKTAPHTEACKRYIQLGPEGDEDRALLIIAERGAYRSPRTEAVGRIRDQAALEQVYRENKNSDARVAALARIENRALLEQVASDPKAPYDHFRAAFMALPCADERIAKLVSDFLYRSGNWESRRACAEELCELLKQNPGAAKLLWHRAANTAGVPHQDSSRYEDNGMPHRSGDCSHDDYMRHTDTGVGEPFPPYPFGDD